MSPELAAAAEIMEEVAVCCPTAPRLETQALSPYRSHERSKDGQIYKNFAYVRCVQVKQFNLLGLQRLQTFLQPALEVVFLVRVQCWSKFSRLKLSADEEASFLPFQLAKILLGGAAAVYSRGVDLVVPVLLEHVQHCGALLGVMQADCFDACEGHQQQCSWGSGLSG